MADLRPGQSLEAASLHCCRPLCSHPTGGSERCRGGLRGWHPPGGTQSSVSPVTVLPSESPDQGGTLQGLWTQVPEARADLGSRYPPQYDLGALATSTFVSWALAHVCCCWGLRWPLLSLRAGASCWGSLGSPRPCAKRELGALGSPGLALGGPGWAPIYLVPMEGSFLWEMLSSHVGELPVGNGIYLECVLTGTSMPPVSTQGGGRMGWGLFSSCPVFGASSGGVGRGLHHSCSFLGSFTAQNASHTPKVKFIKNAPLSLGRGAGGTGTFICPDSSNCPR